MSLKGLFFKENEDSEVKISEPKKNVASTNFPPPAPPTTVGTGLNIGGLPHTHVAVSTTERDEFVAFLNDVYKNGNFPGPDYQEFTDALKTMATQPLPENIKYTAIFAGFSVQGVTKNRLVETGLKYIEMIKSKCNDFNKEVDNMLSTEVADKQKKIVQITQDNDAIEKQLITLTEKKNKNVELINSIGADVNDQVAQLTVKKSAFESASNEFINNVQSNIEKIKTYLP